MDPTAHFASLERTNRDDVVVEVVLARRPGPTVLPTDFDVRRRSVAEDIDRELAGADTVDVVYVRAEATSIDPYVRARMQERASYKPFLKIGEIIPAEAVVTVIASSSSEYPVGSTALAHIGWRTHALLPGSSLRPVPAGLEPSSAALGIAGMPGLTAYSALHEYGRLRRGETVVVASATGPVGSAVAQIARRAGARVVGVTSSVEKATMAVRRLGFDAAVNRRAPTFAQDLADACPDGIDLDFETAGGHVFETVLPLLNKNARVLVCGLIGQWGQAPQGVPSARDLLRATLDRSLSVHGFVVGDIGDAYRPRFEQDVVTWLREGTMTPLTHEVRGMANAPTAFIDMLSGAHPGKTVVLR